MSAKKPLECDFFEVGIRYQNILQSQRNEPTDAFVSPITEVIYSADMNITVSQKFTPLFTALIIVVAIVVTALLIQSTQTDEEHTHYHTGFLVYENGELRDFSADDFMYIKACGIEEDHSEPEAADKAHLHNNIGDIVHVHHAEASIEDMIESLQLDTTADWRAYTEAGTQLSLSSIVPDNENIILTDVALSPEQIAEFDFPTQEYITEVEENTYENCGI